MLFVCPVPQDLHTLHTIFGLFEGASGLGFNINKCQLAPIRCSEDQIVSATSIFCAKWWISHSNIWARRYQCKAPQVSLSTADRSHGKQTTSLERQTVTP
jgi:hypothetical protein